MTPKRTGHIARLLYYCLKQYHSSATRFSLDMVDVKFKEHLSSKLPTSWLPQPLTYPGIILSDCISKMSSLEELIKKIGESVRGNVDPEELGFEDATVTIDRMPNLSVQELQAEHYQCSQIQAAAKQLGLGILEKSNALCLSYIAVLAKKLHNKTLKDCSVSASDVAETSLSFIDEVKNTILSVALRHPPDTNSSRQQDSPEVEVVEEQPRTNPEDPGPVVEGGLNVPAVSNEAPAVVQCQVRTEREESGTVARDQECVAGTEDQVRKQSAEPTTVARGLTEE